MCNFVSVKGHKMFVFAHLLGGIKALYPHQEYRKSNVKELDYFPEQTEPGVEWRYSQYYPLFWHNYTFIYNDILYDY